MPRKFIFQTILFCELFELEVGGAGSGRKAIVSFDRHKTKSITLEGKSIPMERSHHLVLSKNTLSLGEVGVAVGVAVLKVSMYSLPGGVWWAPPPSLPPHSLLQLHSRSHAQF